MRRPGSWGGFPLTTHTLMLVLVMTLARSAAGAPPIKGRQLQQELEPQGNDTECLKGLVDAARRQGEEDESSSLAKWTATAIGSPCNDGTSRLSGITCNKSRVATIKLPGSNLVGNIPSSLASCYFLQTLDLSWNVLSGPLPPFLGSLSYLSVLSLSNNNLSGQIPYEVATLSSLTRLDLNHNQLVGSIPPQLGLLSLQFLNLSDNKLSGRIPATLSNTSTGAPRFNASSFANNPNLYGFPIPVFIPSPRAPPKQGPPLFSVILIGLVSGLAFVTVVFYSIWLITCLKERRELEAAQERERARRRRKHDDEEGFKDGWKEVLEQLS